MLSTSGHYIRRQFMQPLKPLHAAIWGMFLIAHIVHPLKAQDSSFYRVNLPLEGSLSALGFVTTSLLFPRLYQVSTLRENDVLLLDREDVNAFDRSVINTDPNGFKVGQSNSDLWMNISLLAPFTLLADQQIREDWSEFLVLYLETQMVNTTMYQMGAFSVRRPRPLTYNQELSPGERTGEQRSNSFYSGHVSAAATATFFMAKVYTDYHHIKGWKRVLFYGVASVPPTLVGYHRVKAGKHFKTDILVGFLTGALNGMLIPELHKRLKGKSTRKPK